MMTDIQFQRKDVGHISYTSGGWGIFYFVIRGSGFEFRATIPAMNALFNAQPNDIFVAKKKRIYWYIEVE